MKRFSWMMVAGIVMAIGNGCEHRVNGSKASEVFEEPHVQSLAVAGARGKLQEMEAAIKMGADVNAIGARGMTPLLWLLKAEQPEAVRKLLEAGAEPNYRIPERGHSPVSVAAEAADPRLLKVLLDNGGDPNSLGPRGDPALHVAVKARRMQNVELLLQYGADINLQNSSGYTAAMRAELFNDYSYIIYLLEKGADHNIVNDAGWTLAHEVQHQDPELLRDEIKQERARVIDILDARGVRFPVPYNVGERRPWEVGQGPATSDLKTYYKWERIGSLFKLPDGRIIDSDELAVLQGRK